MSEETRLAAAAFVLHGAGGIEAQGQGEAVIGNDGVTVGPVTVAFLDADSLTAGDHRLALDC